MNDNEKKSTNSKTLSLRGTGGAVRMNLSHGRSKSVLIETKRKKILLPNKNTFSSNQNPGMTEEKTADNNIKQPDSKIQTNEQMDRRKKAIEAAREQENRKKEEDKILAEKVLNEKITKVESSSKENGEIQKNTELPLPIEEPSHKQKTRPDTRFEPKTDENPPGKKFKKEETIELSLMDARLIYEHLCTYETYDFHDRITQLGIGRLCVILKKKI